MPEGYPTYHIKPIYSWEPWSVCILLTCAWCGLKTYWDLKQSNALTCTGCGKEYCATLRVTVLDKD